MLVFMIRERFDSISWSRRDAHTVKLSREQITVTIHTNTYGIRWSRIPPDWSSDSPHLNSIEHRWQIIKTETSEVGAETTENLNDGIKYVWNSLTDVERQTLRDPMNNRPQDAARHERKSKWWPKDDQFLTFRVIWLNHNSILHLCWGWERLLSTWKECQFEEVCWGDRSTNTPNVQHTRVEIPNSIKSLH
jgi:hypothetical protein